MLIYNFQKEFIGIDAQDLKTLGFENLEQLRAESADFADLFVKTPGFIHNFVNLHWIDYIASAESFESSKAIIHVNNKNYKCNLDIKTIFLVDSPTENAYLIDLVNLRALSNDELEHIKKDLKQKPEPRTTLEKQQLFQGQDLEKRPQTSPSIVEKTKTLEVKEENYEPTKEEQIELTKTSIENKEDITVDDEYIKPKTPEELPVIEEDVKIDLEMDDVIPKPKETTPQPNKTKDIKPKPKESNTTTDKENDVYIYDPKVASDELGLPIDLIEEFLEDFIAQAEEFKDKLYDAINTEDISSAKSLSHKLKGVAANLRIEDAFEVLATANTSDNLNVIKTNIDTFYKIMSKLSVGESLINENELNASETEVNKEDDTDYDDSLFINFDEDEKEKILENVIDDTQTNTKDVSVVYDKISTAKEIGIDNQFFNELFNDFVTDTAVLISSINNAIEKNNSQEWKKNAHTLKGMSDNMRVSSYANEIDTLLSTDDLKVAKDATDKISSDLKQISNL